MGWLLSGFFGLLLAMSAANAAERRFALVVGMQDYEAYPATSSERQFARLPKLDNPIPDANLISRRLIDNGFDVDLKTDASRSSLMAAVTSFAERLDAAKRQGDRTTALFYFAGHGVQDRRKANWLIPRDARLATEIDLPLQAVDLGDVLRAMQYAAPDIAFAIIDACRDSPLPERSVRGDVTQGLAVPGEGRGILIAFSAEPGKKALDGEPGENSPFAAALGRQLETPGIDASAMFNVVAQDVLRDTQQAQFPRIFPGLTQPFIFKASADPANPAPERARTEKDIGNRTTSGIAASNAPADNTCDNDYGASILENSQRAYDAFLRRCVGSSKENIIKKLRQRLIEDELWRRIEAASERNEKRRLADLLISAYPDSDYVSRAKDLVALSIGTQVPAYASPTIPANTLEARVTLHRSEDAPGNDLDMTRGVGDENDCARLCEQAPACNAFTFNTRAGVCFRKTRVVEFKPMPDAISGVLNGRTPMLVGVTAYAQPKFITHPKLDAPYNDFGGGRKGWIADTTEPQCRAICIGNPECAGYTFNFTKNNTCIQKTAIGSLRSHPDNIITVEIIRR